MKKVFETVKKEPIKKLPKCWGEPEAECVGNCLLEPSCANLWLFRHQKKTSETDDIRPILDDIRRKIDTLEYLWGKKQNEH